MLQHSQNVSKTFCTYWRHFHVLKTLLNFVPIGFIYQWFNFIKFPLYNYQLNKMNNKSLKFLSDADSLFYLNNTQNHFVIVNKVIICHLVFKLMKILNSIKIWILNFLISHSNEKIDWWNRYCVNHRLKQLH